MDGFRLNEPDVNQERYEQMARYHQRMADLPFEEKLEVFVRLRAASIDLRAEFEKSRLEKERSDKIDAT